MPDSRGSSSASFSRHRLALNGLARTLSSRTLRHPAERIVIAGGPRSGKSTLAQKLAVGGYRVHNGEELVGIEWSAGSERFTQWLDEQGPWICENVAAARGLRKWLAAHPVGLPADLFIQLDTQVAARVEGQHRMALSCRTVWNQIEPELARRGAKILRARNL